MPEHTFSKRYIWIGHLVQDPTIQKPHWNLNVFTVIALVHSKLRLPDISGTTYIDQTWIISGISWPLFRTRKLSINLDLNDIVTTTSGKMKLNMTKIVDLNHLWTSSSELKAFIASLPQVERLTITPATVNFKRTPPENQNRNLSIQELVFAWWSKIDILALQDTLQSVAI